MRKREKIIFSFALLGVFISLSYLVVIPLSRIEQPNQDVSVSEEFEPAELPQIIDLDLPSDPVTELPEVIEVEEEPRPSAQPETKPQTLPDNSSSNGMEISPEIQQEVNDPVAMDPEEVTTETETQEVIADQNTQEPTRQETAEFFDDYFAKFENTKGGVAQRPTQTSTISYDNEKLLTLLVATSTIFGLGLVAVWWKEIKI